MATEYRIEYSIQRALEGETDFTEVGFGSSGSWDDIDSAMYAASTDIQRRSWETQPGMPEPETIEDVPDEEDR